MNLRIAGAALLLCVSAGLQAAARKGLPVIIMEPLRGGKLVNLLPEPAKKLLAEDPRGWSAAEWALRWLWDQPEVTCVLSGMNSLDMVAENCRIADAVRPGAFTDEEFAVLDRVKAALNHSIKAPGFLYEISGLCNLQSAPHLIIGSLWITKLQVGPNRPGEEDCLLLGN